MTLFTLDDLLVAAASALCVPLWIFWKARRNNGIAKLPSMLMFGGTNKYL